MSLYEVTGMMRAIKRRDGPPVAPDVSDDEWAKFEATVAEAARAKG
jgi:hypothetical protein